MEPKDSRTDEKLTTEQGDRILKNPEEEIPKIAKELYPTNKEEQEEFTEDLKKTIMVIGGGECADFVVDNKDIKVEQIERISENPKKEAPKIAKELYPDDKKAQKAFLKYVFDKFTS